MELGGGEMQISKWDATLLQLMQEKKEKEGVANLKLSSSSSSSIIDCSFSISINNNNESSTNNNNNRINPIKQEDDGDNNCCIVSSRKGGGGERKEESNPADAWLPITESRVGNIFFCIFHLISSGLGVQSLLLPLAFHVLGWAWGITWLSMAFIWQIYTAWLLTQLHEASSGYRYSRYLQLAMAAFGPKMGKVVALIPVMYLSGGTCVTLLITGGGTMQHLYRIICKEEAHNNIYDPTTVEWYLIFICLAIAIAQLPNFNSMAWVSLLSAITAIVVYCTLIWVLVVVSIGKDTPSATKAVTVVSQTKMGSMVDVLSAIGIIALSFRGHNLVLEIQGTLPTRGPPHQIMWKGVKFSNAVVAMILFSIAICGYWAFGTLMQDTEIMNTVAHFHGNRGSKLKLAIIYFFLIINSLCSFQIFAMPVFDNLELRYVSACNKPCKRWQRAGLRIFFGGLVFFIAVTAPFLPLLAPLIGAIALPITFAYPCFMWISIKKPTKFGAMWFLNLILGCSAILLSVFLVIAAISNLVSKGLSANFFHPKP